MFGGLMWLIALLVVLVVGGAGLWYRTSHRGRARPYVGVERRETGHR